MLMLVLLCWSELTFAAQQVRFVTEVMSPFKISEG
jgi:hypothetical protein